MYQFPQKYCAARLFSTLIIINVSWAAYYYDFWRSCDTEDCSNDAENTEINYILTYKSHKKSYFKFHNITVFWANKSSLGEYKRGLKNILIEVLSSTVYVFLPGLNEGLRGGKYLVRVWLFPSFFSSSDLSPIDRFSSSSLSSRFTSELDEWEEWGRERPDRQKQDEISSRKRWSHGATTALWIGVRRYISIQCTTIRCHV